MEQLQVRVSFLIIYGLMSSIISVHPSIVSTCLILFRVVRRWYILYLQESMGERRGTPWTGHNICFSQNITDNFLLSILFVMLEYARVADWKKKCCSYRGADYRVYLNKTPSSYSPSYLSIEGVLFPLMTSMLQLSFQK